MMAGVAYPNLLWQYEQSKKWVNCSREEAFLLNKNFQRGDQTFMFILTNPKKDLDINLEKMFQKNLISGLEQHIRCLVLNKDCFFSWSWRDDDGNFRSYTPFVTFYLEICFQKDVKTIDFYIDGSDYIIDLSTFVQIQKGTESVRTISREKIGLEEAGMKNSVELQAWMMISQDFITKMSREQQQSLKNILHGLPVSRQIGNDGQIGNEQIQAPSAIAVASTSLESPTSVAVDPNCPVADQCHIFYDEADIYYAKLNYTNLQDNNNKFYNIQLLEYNNNSKYALWLHWGPVGHKGQNSLLQYNTLDEAKSEFEKRYYDKTKNHFVSRINFQRKRTKYDLVYTDVTSQATKPIVTIETKLDSRIQDLLKLICNKKTLEEAVKGFSYASKKTLIGKITEEQILAGYIALAKIVDILEARGTEQELKKACKVFYTKVPHNFDRKSPPLINNFATVDTIVRMLEALKECLQTTHGPSHHYNLEIIDVFKCLKTNQETNFIDGRCKKLLWHGSRISNFLGILKKGLQIAPPQAHTSAQMFGNGIYFADVCTKSANYCYPSPLKNEGLLLLSEVCLGQQPLEVYEAHDFTDDVEHLSDFSVLGVGRIIPGFKKTVLSSEAELPHGPLINQATDRHLALDYNEYVVYNNQQVKFLYLLRVRFNFH